MASKKELRDEIERLRQLAADYRAKDRDRADRADREFSEALTSITWAEDRKIRIIAPNGTILWALVAEAKVDRNMVDVGGGEMIPGLLDVTLTLHPEPNR